MRLIITIIALNLTAFAYSQMKQKTADTYFAGMEYAKCVEMYNELAQKCIGGHKKGDWSNVRKAAISNFHLFNMKEAIYYFGKLHDKNMLTEQDRVDYIQALRYNENYGKSHVIARESVTLFNQNSFFGKFENGEKELQNLYKDSSLIKVWETSINSDKGDFGPAYFDNGIVFASKAQNTGFINPSYGWDGDYFLNIMHATYKEDSTLSAPSLLRQNFNSRAHDGPVSFNSDETEMVLTRNTIGRKNGKEIIVLALYFSNLENGEWTELKPFEFNSEEYNVGHAVYADNGNTLYFASDNPTGKGGSDIWKTTRLGNSWSEPVAVGGSINTDQDELFPFVQGSKLYFASNGHLGLGGLDMFETNTDGKDIINLGFPINTSHDDFGMILDAKGEIGFVSSNRRDNIDRIYHVKRRNFKILLDIALFAQYKELEPIEGSITIKNLTTNEEEILKTDNSGKLQVKIVRDQEYRVYTKKEEFILLKEASISSRGIRQDSILNAELILKPTTIQVHLRVIEKETGKIIPDATTTITNYNTSWDTTLITNSKGMVTLTVDRNTVLWAHGAKKGYIDADISFNTANKTDKIIDLELALPPIKKGEKFKLENIFYDLNKSTLREESKKSLDKLADFIIENELKIELSAHTDSRGSGSYNQRLSQARAQSCVDYLIQKGIQKSRIIARGYGETKLVNRCKNGVKCSEEEHQENRRTEVKILEVN